MSFNNYKHFSIISFFLLGVIGVKAQTKADDVKITDNIMGNSHTSIFNSPMGSSDLYTGKATYQIPLLELKSHDLTQPITLSYFSGGVSVSEIGGWTGITWRINTGGEITRAMNGYPDEYPGKGFFEKGVPVQDFSNKTKEEKKSLIENAQDNQNDLQPDVFYFSFGGESGYFVFDHLQNINIIPHKNWRITKTISSISKKIISFEIITDNGTKYTFGRDINAIEETRISTLKGKIEFKWYDVAEDNEFGMFKPYLDLGALTEEKLIDDFFNSKWYLVEVESPKLDKLTYTYANAGLVSYVNAPQLLSYVLENFEVYFDYTATNILYQWSSVAKIPFRKVKSILNNIEWENEPYNFYDYEFVTPEGYIEKPINLNAVKYTDDDLIRNPMNFFVHQQKVEIKTCKIVNINSSDGKSIIFQYTINDGTPGSCRLSNIYMNNSNKEIVKKFNLNYKKIISESFDVTGANSDPYSILEIETFRAIVPLNTPNKVPANYAFSHFSDLSIPNKKLLEEYVYEGIKPYNYERYFLTSVSEIGNNNQINQPYIFEYSSPEKIIRRTSVWTSKLNYSIDEFPNQPIFSCYQSLINAQVADGLYKPNGTSFGQLNKITLPTSVIAI